MLMFFNSSRGIYFSSLGLTLALITFFEVGIRVAEFSPQYSVFYSALLSFGIFFLMSLLTKGSIHVVGMIGGAWFEFKNYSINQPWSAIFLLVAVLLFSNLWLLPIVSPDQMVEIGRKYGGFALPFPVFSNGLILAGEYFGAPMLVFLAIYHSITKAKEAREKGILPPSIIGAFLFLLPWGVTAYVMCVLSGHPIVGWTVLGVWLVTQSLLYWNMQKRGQLIVA